MERSISQTKKSNWYLSGKVSEAEGVRHIALPLFPCIVGRRSNVDVSIPCASVSKHHAQFEDVDGKVFLRDLESTNGTFVNGQQLSGQIQVQAGDLVQFATAVFRIGQDELNTEAHTAQEDALDRAMSVMQFDRLLNDGGVVPFFQPIMKLQTDETFGYEVLGRSRMLGLKTPAEMFSAAAKLNKEVELSREMRIRGVKLASLLNPEINLFLNTHPIELAQPGLVESLTDLRELAPQTPITLEIHESAITNPESIVELKEDLVDLNMRLAFDDFGNGRSRWIELSEVRPDFVKFDMTLTQDIHSASAKRQEVVSLIAKMVNDLGLVAIAEGVEAKESHDMLVEMNVGMGQGFYYGRPEPISSYADLLRQ